LAQPNINVTVDLFQTPAQLLDTVHGFFDPSSQLTHLGLEPIHADLHIDCCVGA
jgi:hypothetical protein